VLKLYNGHFLTPTIVKIGWDKMKKEIREQQSLNIIGIIISFAEALNDLETL
jgi:hypothetical protein